MNKEQILLLLSVLFGFGLIYVLYVIAQRLNHVDVVYVISGDTKSLEMR